MTQNGWIANSPESGKRTIAADEIIERIYIGRRFKNDTERLEKLFDLYTKMTSQPTPGKKSGKRKTKS
jgi:hypothetical protein